MNARRAIKPACAPVSAVTLKSGCINGTNNTNASRNVPIKKAPTLAVFEKSPSLKIECVLLQLKPWYSHASVSVANAIVLATAGLV